MLRWELEYPSLRLGVVCAEQVVCGPSEAALEARLRELEVRLRGDPSLFPEPVRRSIRDLLRSHGYKPTGRGKPASEFLLAAALGPGLMRINNLVDINNLVSVRSALPISIFDRDRAGSDLLVRVGRPGEVYVFNASGQSMGIAGLPVVCRAAGDQPIGNAVKDSMLTKVDTDTRRVLAVIYASTTLPPLALKAATHELGELLQQHAGARTVTRRILPDGPA